MIIRRFRSNILLKTAGEVIARIGAFLFYAVGARILGVEEFGLFSLSYSYAFILVVMMDWGMSSVITRELARHPRDISTVLPSLLLYKLCLIPFALIFVWLVVTLIGYDARMIRVTLIMCFVAVGFALVEYLTSVLSGLEKMGIEAWVKAIWKMGGLVFAYVCFKMVHTLESFVVGLALGQWIAVMTGFVLVHLRVTKLTAKCDFDLIKRFVKASFPVFVSWIFLYFYDNQDLIILSYLSFPNDDIGLFSSSAKLIDALRPLPFLLVGAVYPILSEMALKNKDKYATILRPLLSYSILFLVPFSFVISWFSELVIRIVYGAEYQLASPVFAVAIWGYIGVFLNYIVYHAIISLDGQNKIWKASLVVTLSNAVLCIVLFKTMGLSGGAWALLGAECIFAATNLRLLKNKYGDGPLFDDLIKSLLFFLGWGVVVLGLKLLFPPLLVLLLGLVLYAAGILKFRLIDWGLIRRMRG